MMGFEMKVTGTDLTGQQAAGKPFMEDSRLREGNPVWPINLAKSPYSNMGEALEATATTLANAKFEKAWKNLGGGNEINITLTHDGNKNDKFESRTFNIKDEESMKEFVKYLLQNGLSGGNVLDSIATALDHIATAGVTAGFGNKADIEMKIDT